MKLLLDTCVSPRARDELAAAGHDVVWVGDWTVDPGDEAILERALHEGRIVVTLDKDFGELAVVFRRRHAGIIRFVDISARMLGRLCANAIEAYGADLSKGAMLTVEPHRVRVRPPGDDDGGGP